MHRSLLKRFPLFIWLLFAVSSVPNFCPDTGGRRWPLVQVASSIALQGGAGAAFPFTLLRLPAVLYEVCPALRGVPALGVPQKRGTKGCACFLHLPRPSGSGSQELDGRTLPGAARLLPSASPAPVPACAGRMPVPWVSLQPSRRMSTIQNLRRSLIRNWRPVCSAVGVRSLGSSLPLSPPPCLLVRLGRSAAG